MLGTVWLAVAGGEEVGLSWDAGTGDWSWEVVVCGDSLSYWTQHLSNWGYFSPWLQPLIRAVLDRLDSRLCRGLLFRYFLRGNRNWQQPEDKWSRTLEPGHHLSHLEVVLVITCCWSPHWGVLRWRGDSSGWASPLTAWLTGYGDVTPATTSCPPLPGLWLAAATKHRQWRGGCRAAGARHRLHWEHPQLYSRREYILQLS